MFRTLAPLAPASLLLLCCQSTLAASLPAGFGPCEGSNCPAAYAPIGVCPNNGIGSDSAWSAFIGGNLTVADAAELEGLAVIGGDFNMQRAAGYNVGVAGVGSCVTAPDASTHLFVGGDAQTPSPGGSILLGALGISGDLEVGGINSASVTNCPTCAVGALSDPNFATSVTDTLDSLRTLSSCISTFDASSDPQVRQGLFADDGFGNITLDCATSDQTGGMCNPGIYVYDLPGDIGPAAFTGTISAPTLPTDGSATILMNMSGAGTVNANVQFTGGFAATYARFTLWNFANATQLNLNGSSQFDGTILAPNADVTIYATGLNGRFIAGGDVAHLGNGSEFHNFDFIGEVPDACVATAPTPTPAPALDFGDAPAPYPTDLANDGARHSLLASGNPSLGATVDSEADGQASATFAGDDSSGGSGDEDGVSLPPTLTQGAMALIPVSAGAAGGRVDAWIDWNGDGDWSDLGEQIAMAEAVAANSTVLLTALVPPTASPGVTGARFRISLAGGLSPTGPAPDGEVEDYAVTIADAMSSSGTPLTPAPTSGTSSTSRPAAEPVPTLSLPLLVLLGLAMTVFASGSLPRGSRPAPRSLG